MPRLQHCCTAAALGVLQALPPRLPHSSGPCPPPPACRSFKPSQAHLQGASIEHLVETGKKASLEHRRHHVEPTLLGLHEASSGQAAGGRA